MDAEAPRRLDDLVAYPREELNVEIKGWLDLSAAEDKAKLAKAAIALANSGGGYIVIGFTEVGGDYSVSPPPHDDLASYGQDAVNNAVNRYAEPPIHCGVTYVRTPSDEQSIPVISVPAGSKAPIRSKRHGPNGSYISENTYYIRRPGPKSESPQSGKEWDELISRCVRAAKTELIDDIRSLMLGHRDRVSSDESETEYLQEWAESCSLRWRRLIEEHKDGEAPHNYWHGTYTVAYRLLSAFSRPSLTSFLETLSKVRGHETGWPPWWVPTRDEIAPYPIDDLIECWIGREERDPAHSDFWRAAPDGYLYLKRGLEEDSYPDKGEPGKYFDLTLPIWRTAECILHASRLADALGVRDTEVEILISWEGLKDREIVTWGNPRRMVFESHVARQNGYSQRIQVAASEIESTLPEIVESIVEPLFEIFSFLRPTKEIYREEIGRMMGR